MRRVAVVLFLIPAPAAAADLPPGAVLRLGDTRFRARGEVRHLEFRADGTLAGWTTDGPVAWDDDGVPRRVPFDRPPPGTDAHATPAVKLAGDRVLTAGPGAVGRVWDATTAKQLAALKGHAGVVTAVAVSADGKRLATGSGDGLVRVWDAATFRPLTDPRGHTAAVRTVRVSPDGKRALTTGDDGSARVWDLATGKELAAVPAAGVVGLTPDGTGVVVRANGRVVVWDVLTRHEVIPDSLPEVPHPTVGELLALWGACLAVSPDGRTVALSHPDGTIGLYESATGGLRRTLPGHGSACLAVAFTPDGSRLLTGGTDHAVLVWDVRLQAVPLPAAVRNETRAATHWATLTTGPADQAYLAAARLAAEPPAAVRMARLRLKPAAAEEPETATTRLADTRAIELLEALGTAEARAFLQELAAGEPAAWRTREATRAVGRE
jgi:hypothetical protein